MHRKLSLSHKDSDSTLVDALEHLEIKNEIQPDKQPKAKTELQKLIDEHLKPSLEKKKDVWDELPRNHPLFDSAKLMCKKYDLPAQSFHNFRELLVGNLDLPVILLQNPKNDHLNYGRMVHYTRSLLWLHDILQCHGLAIDNVIIMNLFPMLTDEWLGCTDTDKKKDAIKDSFNLTLQFLQTVKPPIILSFQCFASGYEPERWGIQNDPVIHSLSSSIYRARKEKVQKISLDEHSFHVIQGFPPAAIWDQEVLERSRMECNLADIMREVYKPCGQWKNCQLARVRL
jgi:hypothetical protein